MPSIFKTGLHPPLALSGLQPAPWRHLPRSRAIWKRTAPFCAAATREAECLRWVKTGNDRRCLACPVYPQEADVAAIIEKVGFGPLADISGDLVIIFPLPAAEASKIQS